MHRRTERIGVATRPQSPLRGTVAGDSSSYRSSLSTMLIAFLFLSGAVQGAWAAAQCNMRSGSTCACDMADGSGFIDLSLISNNGDNPKPFFPNIPQPSSRWFYSYNPCKGFDDGHCVKDNAVCQNHGDSCGRQPNAKIDTTVNPPTITYTGGDVFSTFGPRKSVVALVCDLSTDHDMKWSKEDPKGTYQYTLTSNYACVQKPAPPATTQAPPPGPTQEPPPAWTTSQRRSPEHNIVSLGTILDISVIFLLSTYFAVGFAFMYVHRGERGRQALPNYAFWAALPGLIKEGTLFIVSKARRSREGYEQI
ncbi:uncharacterized protein LOC135812178 [Sycon ciliatum]|uniref:uncharacterized protein LOC135812178 n=1 Tax=Sycon ciliatum TaxID=27933 RepID=UPI0031F6A12F